jgi:hypothetical protein
MASRLVALGRLMKAPGDDPVTVARILPKDQEQEELLAAKAELDTAINDQRAEALGEVGGSLIAAFETGLPDNGGEAEAISQPEDVERFGAASFTWNGGDNFTDNAHVEVERLVDGQWQPYADQSGEIPVTLEFPKGEDFPVYVTGGEEWEWTAHFEAFVSPFPTGAPSDSGGGPQATPEGTYRFVVDGLRREGGEAVPYHIESAPFEVGAWSGIAVEDFRLEPNHRMSFRVGPRHTFVVSGGDLGVGGPDITAEIGPIDYPDSYASSVRFIRERRRFRRDPDAPGDPSKLEWFCFTCSFRPWIDAGNAQTAEVKIVDVKDNTIEIAPATERGGRWVTRRRLRKGEIAFVAEGGVRDPFRNFNGAAAGPLFLGSQPPTPRGGS